MSEKIQEKTFLRPLFWQPISLSSDSRLRKLPERARNTYILT